MGEGDGTMCWGPFWSTVRIWGFTFRLYRVCLPFIQMVFIGHLGRINLGLDGEDILGSRINFFPRKSLPISIFLSLLSNLSH